MLSSILAVILTASFVRHPEVSASPIPTRASEDRALLETFVTKGANISVWSPPGSPDLEAAQAPAWVLVPPVRGSAAASLDDIVMAIRVAVPTASPDPQRLQNKAELITPPKASAAPADQLVISILVSTPTTPQ
jgi:hypothetical protein